MLKLLAMWITTNREVLTEMVIPDHLTCLLRNLCAGQEATVITGHGPMGWFKTEKGVCQGCILSPCLFNLYAEYIMRNAGLDEAQAGIKNARRQALLQSYSHQDSMVLAQRQKYRSVEQKRKLRDKSTHLWTPYL